MKQEESIWTLMARKLAGEATEAEVKELEDVVKADPDLHFTIETFYKLWNAWTEMPTEESNADKLWERIRSHIGHHELNRDKREGRYRCLPCQSPLVSICHYGRSNGIQNS